MKKEFILLTILFFSNNFLQAQAKFSYGPEIGLSISQLWHWDTQKLQTGEKFESESPLLGPSIGYHSQVEFKSGLFVQGTIGYQYAGTKSYYKREETIPRITNQPILYSYSNEHRIKYDLHKIELPLSLGYVFNKTRLKPAFYIGGSLNWLFKAKYSTKSKYWRSKPLTNESSEESLDLLDEKTYRPLKSFSFQWLAGVSIYISNNLKLSFNANFGKPFEYIQYKHSPFECLVAFNTIPNNEFGINVAWLLNNKNTNRAEVILD